MKSQKGITLTSLAIYVIIVLIVLGIMTVIFANMNNGIDGLNDQGNKMLEINKFNMYFLQEVKKMNNEVVTTQEGERIELGNTIEFKTGCKYIYDGSKNSIFLEENSRKIVIAENISDCRFIKDEENNKPIIEVIINEETIKYVLNTDANISQKNEEIEYINFEIEVTESWDNRSITVSKSGIEDIGDYTYYVQLKDEENNIMQQEGEEWKEAADITRHIFEGLEEGTYYVNMKAVDNEGHEKLATNQDVEIELQPL